MYNHYFPIYITNTGHYDNKILFYMATYSSSIILLVQSFNKGSKEERFSILLFSSAIFVNLSETW